MFHIQMMSDSYNLRSLFQSPILYYLLYQSF
nr:MAG TPA: hypothetical protein [Caudoviricetes sp.]